MRRILLMLFTALVFLVVSAVPVFAKAQHFEGQGGIEGNPNIAECQGTLSDSGNENSQCSIKEPGSNKGGSGGGGADVRDIGFEMFTALGDGAQLVRTPSGNDKVVGHAK
jgi:hypothetical protein